MVLHWQTVIPITELFICIIFALFVYSQLGSFKHRPWYVTVLTLLGWICCFYIVFLVANDVAQVLFFNKYFFLSIYFTKQKRQHNAQSKNVVGHVLIQLNHVQEG